MSFSPSDVSSGSEAGKTKMVLYVHSGFFFAAIFATLWPIFSQTHLVALSLSRIVRRSSPTTST
jgi:hypothetical protein